MLKITDATTSQMPLVKELFLEYADSLDFDLGFQGFGHELASLPGDYSQPSGFILLAFHDLRLAGCIALRPLEKEICEMKRLYVRPDFHGLGIGRALANALLEKAKQSGYKKIRLDTVPNMKAAIQLYQSMGFYPIAAYRENPIAGASYLEKEIF
jgi:ribosomal protein S18 acetylase RimI-like enzyme